MELQYCDTLDCLAYCHPVYTLLLSLTSLGYADSRPTDPSKSQDYQQMNTSPVGSSYYFIAYFCSA